MLPLHARVTAPATVDLPESGPGLSWRPLTLDDVDAVYELRRAVGVVDHPQYVVTLDEIRHDLGRPEVDLALDTVAAHDATGRLVAYGIVLLHQGQETLVKVALDGGLSPLRRREGIGRRLLAWEQQRGLQLLATSDRELPGWLTSQAIEEASGSRALFSEAGFDERRWWLELARDLSAPIDVVEPAAGLRLEAFGPALYEPARLARNEVFRDHWGSQPMPREAWESYRTLEIARDDLSTVAVDEATGEIVAFVLCEVNEEEWAQVGRSFGYIGLVGVRRSWRGRKVAQALLTRTMLAFREAGFAQAVLDVDSDSPTGAVGLYEGLGFRAVNRSISLVREF